MKIAAIIPAGGSGLRMGYSIPKTYLTFDSVPIIVHTLRIFQDSSLIDDVYLVVQENDREYAKNEIVEKYALTKVRAIIAAGKERQDSVNHGLTCLTHEHEFVVIHDGVRPLLEKKMLEKTIHVAMKEGAAITGVPVKDTVKSINKLSIIKKTIDRHNLFLIQTPQVFKKGVIVKAYIAAYQDQYYGTDDSSLVERLGIPVKMVEGSYENIKITTPDDLMLAELIVQKRKSHTQ
jgi:2-C-methyl-D-erythritol 4-phosphate cytidylyltransferase